MKKNYSRNIQLRCVVCGSDSDFESNEDKTYIKCTKCNREYPGGYDELIDEKIERTKDEIANDVHDELSEILKKAFKGNKHFKIK